MKGNAKCYDKLREYLETVPLVDCHDHTISCGPKYADPINISSTKVLRARAYKGGTPVSEDVSQVYVVNYKGHISVLSLATDESNLYGGKGIFDHPKKRGVQWERPVSVNLLEVDGSGFQINAGLRIHGQHSRTYPKKSMRLYFRSDYGKGKLKYKMFKLYCQLIFRF